MKTAVSLKIRDPLLNPIVTALCNHFFAIYVEWLAPHLSMLKVLKIVPWKLWVLDNQIVTSRVVTETIKCLIEGNSLKGNNKKYVEV